MRFTRRSLIAAIALCAAGPARPLGKAAESPAALARLRNLARHPASARAVGAIYARANPAEAERPVLVGLLLRSLSLDEGRLDRESEAALRERLRARVRADFASGDIADTGGWILSRTEARLCALWA